MVLTAVRLHVMHSTACQAYSQASTSGCTAIVKNHDSYKAYTEDEHYLLPPAISGLQTEARGQNTNFLGKLRVTPTLSQAFYI